MDLFWKSIAGLLIAAVLGCLLGKDMAFLLSILACAMGIAAAMRYLEPVIRFLEQIRTLSGMDVDTMDTLLKVLGIGLISETAMMVCSDSGQASYGKVIKVLSITGVLWVSIPMFQSVVNLLQQLLGEL